MFENFVETLRLWWDRTQPGVWRRMKPSYRWATSIAILATLWIGSGFITGTKSPVTDASADAKTGRNTARASGPA